MNKATPFLSIIIPAHNEAERLPQALQAIQSYLAGKSFTAEVIVVENASTDQTAEVVNAKASQAKEFLELEPGKMPEPTLAPGIPG